MLTAESTITLPDAPADQAALPVAAWTSTVTIDTYLPEAPDRYPAYLDSRVYQGSSGRVYPLPFHERISQQKHPHEWQAVHLENEYVRLMLLPQLGGRIHIGIDKTNGYDFFYRNDVIKPALVGLAGPWVAGGVEFNWPQHHRPTTFLPTDFELERELDGAVTVWCSDHDPFARMKGMHGVRLRPGSSAIEVRVRLYNRAEQTETFLWWANVAARAGSDYQSFFPTDVTVVADHAKRAISAFPAADRPYYGIDYPARRDIRSQPDSALLVPGDRIDWYRNIPVPTSYMCLDSTGDFFGGYDHGLRAGFVHVADHSIATGKKQWTWGNADFGHAWDRNLSDDRAPYVELMAGVYTDNQPDFSFLAPGETKVFSQFWYPIREIGPAQQATVDAALHLERISDERMEIGVSASRSIEDAELRLINGDGDVVWSDTADLSPARPYTSYADVSVGAGRLELIVSQHQVEIVSWALETRAIGDVTVEPAAEPAPPEKIASVEELYLTGLHLRQYRHATRSPEPYWREALLRDPMHSASHTALADLAYRSGRFKAAEEHLLAAVRRLTGLNPNPIESRPHYLLGIVLERLGQVEAAESAFAKAAWNRAWRAPAEYRRARIAARTGDDETALARVDAALSHERDHLQARALRVILLRRLGRTDEADQQLDDTLRLDPLDMWNRHLAGLGASADAQTCVDVALEYRGVGERTSALELLDDAYVAETQLTLGQAAVRPLVAYYAAEVLMELGDHEAAAEQLERARSVDAAWCFPGRLDDAELLRRRVAATADDARAHALLGHWLYANGARDEAIEEWTAASQGVPDAVAHRNLGLAAFNVASDPRAARRHYDQALAIAPGDARLLFERDQLLARMGVPPAERLEQLDAAKESLDQRDDLTITYATLLIDVGRLDEARHLLRKRRFQPWEGGEGQVLHVWERLSLITARQAMDDSQPALAVAELRTAITPPESLGEARHPLANDSALRLALGDALAAEGHHTDAKAQWRRAATFVGDFRGMAAEPYSEMTFYSILAWRQLGESARADALMAGLERYRSELQQTRPEVDYFATSLPDLLLFTDDLVARRDRLVRMLSAQLAVLRGDVGAARSLLQELLQADPGNPPAIDLAGQLEQLSATYREDMR